MRGLLVSLLLMPVGAAAQVVGDCDSWVANARNFDWKTPTRTFANGEIRLTQLDTGEPAAAAFHMVVTYVAGEDGMQDCRLISAGEGFGFPSLDIEKAFATYDPARGLSVEVPGLTVEGDALIVAFTVNRATGAVTVP